MKHDDLFRSLDTLTKLDAPSGFEEPVLRYVRDLYMAGDLCDDSRVDVRGNLLMAKHGVEEDGLKIMVVAHADEVGFMVTGIDDEGFLRFTRLGHPTAMVLPGQPVRVITPYDPLDGVIGVKPGHVLSGDEATRVPGVENMYIDIGAESHEQALEWGLETGTPVVFRGALTRTKHPSRVFGKAIDDRAGILAMFGAAGKLSHAELSATIIWCVSVEEEVGLRGAAVAASDVRPDVLIALDTCPAGGTPDLEDRTLPWRIGKGPLVKVRETSGLSTHGPLRAFFRDIAQRNGIPTQLIVDTAGITDATSTQQAGGCVAAMSLGLPRRYSHSAVELFDLEDLASLIALLAAALPELRHRDQLLRI